MSTGQTRVPGVKARHAIITPRCRATPRPYYQQSPQDAAFEEAVSRLRDEYRAICNGRDDDFNIHLILTLEKP